MYLTQLQEMTNLVKEWAAQMSFLSLCEQTNEPAIMALIEILIGVGVIVGAIVLIVGLD